METTNFLCRRLLGCTSIDCWCSLLLPTVAIFHVRIRRFGPLFKNMKPHGVMIQFFYHVLVVWRGCTANIISSEKSWSIETFESAGRLQSFVHTWWPSTFVLFRRTRKWWVAANNVFAFSRNDDLCLRFRLNPVRDEMLASWPLKKCFPREADFRSPRETS